VTTFTVDAVAFIRGTYRGKLLLLFLMSLRRIVALRQITVPAAAAAGH
jgi:hypothetical protein